MKGKRKHNHQHQHQGHSLLVKIKCGPLSVPPPSKDGLRLLQKPVEHGFLLLLPLDQT